MKIGLKTRIEQLENRIMPEADGKLPLAVLRRFADGSVSPSEVMRWRPVIVQIIAAANLAKERGATAHLVFPA
jgi:hypothetical protein